MNLMLLVIVFGLIFGSFLNVVIARLPEKKSLVTPGSHCPRCGKPVRFYDNIPVLSFLLLRGKCRDCRAPISWQYPLVELATALILALVFMKYGFSKQFVLVGTLALLLIPISVIDMKQGLILNSLTVPGFILGIFLNLWLQIEHWQNVLLGSLGGGIIILAIALLAKAVFKKESLGMGDVKLIVLIGAYVGFPDVAICLFFGAFCAAVFILGGMVFRRIKLGNTIPFGPFIALGTLGYLLCGDSIILWYLNVV